MEETVHPRFDLASFHTRVGATSKERNVLRQDLLRGLKDYFRALYGYDRFGAETILHMPTHMSTPYIYGFGMVRILHDRRVTSETKNSAAAAALEDAIYDVDGGLPFGFFAALENLESSGRLPLEDLRYGLTLSAGEFNPFAGTEKALMFSFFDAVLVRDDMAPVERAFWAHSLVTRHQDRSGASDLIDRLLGAQALPPDTRRELCWAWVNFRQPRLDVPIPPEGTTERSRFSAQHLPFWTAHMPSFPAPSMVRLGLEWLARLGASPFELATEYLDFGRPFPEQAHAAVANILSEHRATMTSDQLESLVERGLAMKGSSATRRRFYRLGADLFGSRYLDRAAADPAGSIREWAARQGNEGVTGSRDSADQAQSAPSTSDGRTRTT